MTDLSWPMRELFPPAKTNPFNSTVDFRVGIIHQE
jgi:hypothetical protein